MRAEKKGDQQMTGPERSDAEIRPFRIDVPQTDLDDLRERLAGPTSCRAGGGAGACRSDT
jgi:hypothetical protein